MAVFEIATFSTLAKLLLAARKLAVDPDPLNRAKALADLAENARALDGKIRAAGLSPLAAEMGKRARALDGHLTHEGWAKNDARLIFWQVAPHALADPGLLTGAALDADVATNAMIAAIKASPMERDFRQTAYAETYFRQVMSGTLWVMLADRAFVDGLSPDLWRESLATAKATREDTDEILALVRDLHRIRQTTVHQDTLIAIARKIRPQVADRDQALRELDRAADIAAAIDARGAAPGNTDAFVDEVLRRLRDLTDAGDLDGAVSEADRAFAEWQDRQAREQANGMRLLTAAIDQHLLAFDADGAAARIEQRVEMETPDPGARFDALRAERDVWSERGRDKGLNLDLRVAIALAEASHRIATDDWQRGAALNDLGNTLQTLGAREQDKARLQQAVAAYSAALTIRTRDALPLDWAMTQTNLGAALRTLGEREQGIARLEQAVAAYEAALTVHTRDALPLDWAATQNNLGNALTALGVREEGTARLEQAVAAFEAALTVLTRDALPLQWAMTQNNLGNALRTLGQREESIARLQQAIAAYEAALTVRTRDVQPFDWAQTRENMALAHLALFRKTGDRAQLDLAKEAVAEALEVYTAAGAGHFIAKATRLRDHLDTL